MSRRIDVPLFKKQLEFLNYKTEREVLFEGGIASGKSTVGAFWLVSQVLNHPKSTWLMVARDHGQLEDALVVELDATLELFHLIQDVHYTKTMRPRIQYKFCNGSIINGRGAHNYESAFRGPNYHGAWGDEVDFWKKEAVERLRGRIRRGVEQIRWTSSPFGYNHVYEDFYEKKMGPIVRATSFDNPTLSPEYTQSLKQTYSPRLYEQEVLAKRLRLNVGAVYSEFDRNVHVKPCRDMLDQIREIYFFTDYNIAHYCGVYMAMIGDTIYAFGEEHLEYKTTRDMAQAVLSKFPDQLKIVVGDSTGNNKRDVAVTSTNYAEFQSHGLMTKPFSNPPVQSRIINANSRLHHHKLIIDPSCQNLIRDMEMVAWKDDGSDIDKRSDLSLTHASDAYTYGVWYFMPLRQTMRGAKIRIS